MDVRRTSCLSGLLLAVVVASASCGPPVPASIVVPLGTNDFGEFALLVYDDSRLVTGGRAESQQQEFGTSGVLAFPERREVRVWWLGGACSHRPALRVSGTAASLHLSLSSPPDFQLPFVTCPGVGILFGVVLLVSEPIAQNSVVFTVGD